MYCTVSSISEVTAVILCVGDNQFAVEKGITDDDVIGVVTAFYRKGKPYTVDSMKYRAYLELCSIQNR